MTVIYEDGSEREGLYFRRDGTPYSGRFRDVVFEWSEDIQNEELKTVKQTELPNGKFAITIWTGICQRVGVLHQHEEPSLIFETIVFPSKNDFTELEIKLHGTEAEAVAGHDKLCKRWSLQS